MFEIAIARKVALFQVTFDAEPIVRGLQWQAQKLCGLQFNNGETSRARDGENIQNSEIASGVCKYLGIGKTRIERRIDSCDVFAKSVSSQRSGCARNCGCIVSDARGLR